MLDRRQVERAFGHAATTYDSAAVLQRDVEDQLLERLDLLPETPERVLDLGAGTGRATVALRQRYREAEVVALDLALPMLQQVRRRGRPWRRPLAICADAEALPVTTASVDLVFSNLLLQWCDPRRVFNEVRRVLRPGGRFLFTTFGPDTLQELRAAWASADEQPHVNQFIDMHHLGDELVRAGFDLPVMDTERLTTTYGSVGELVRELRAIGAGNADSERRRGLTGRSTWSAMREAYENLRRDGRLPATWEVVYGHGVGPDPSRPRATDRGLEAAVPVDTIGRRRR